MALQFETGDGAHALDAFQWTNALLGNLVVSGASVSVGSGTREVDNATGTVAVAGASHSVSAQDPAATLDAATTYPRKDVIYVDNAGAVQVSKGTEAAFDPAGTTTPVEDTISPSPPDMSGVTGTVLAVALVETDDTVTVWDRRQVGRIPNEIVTALQNFGSSDSFDAYPIQTADIGAAQVTASELAAAVAGDGLTGGAGSALAVNAGTGLELDSDALRIAAAAAGDGLTGGAGSALAVDPGNGLQISAGLAAVKESDLDPTNMDGSSGSNGQFLATDGSAASWSSPPGGRNDPMYGDGSDGSITRSANANENGILYTTDYTVQSGVTMSVTNSVLVVHATGSITLDGTLDVDPVAGSGGSGGSSASSGDNGSGGTAGLFGAAGAAVGSQQNGNPGGGGGGDDDFNNGGNGAAAGGTVANNETIRQFLAQPVWESVYDLSVIGGAGGGGGGSWGDTSGDRGGGSGGNGGGVVVLIAPTVTLNGTINLDAGPPHSSQAPGPGGGGGGGGSGGTLILVGDTIDDASLTLSNSGTLGGAAGGLNAGDGGDGENGTKITITG